MIKAILFDLDGTLANTNNLIFESFKYTFKQHGIDGVTDEEIYSFFGEPLTASMRRYVSKDKVEELVETYRVFNHMMHDKMISDFPEVETTLKSLKELGYKLGVVTSKREMMAKKSLDALDLDGYFDILVTPELTTLHKPNKEPVEKGINLCNVLPHECIMVGDSPYDILSGNAAGAYTVAVNYTVIPMEAIIESEPDFFIDSVNELSEIIETLNNTSYRKPIFR